MDEAKSGHRENTGWAIVAYILFFVPLFSRAKRDPFVRYHIKQGLVLFLANVINTIIGRIPFFGWILNPLIGIFLFVLFIIGIMNVLAGKEKELPVIGHFAKSFNF